MELTNNMKCGKCSNCGECCSDILHLDKEEIALIDEYIKNHELKERKTVIDNGNPTIDLTCPFRNNVIGMCNIYEARPYICRLFRCDTPVEKAIMNRDELNKDKKPRSLRAVFFNNEENIEALSKMGIKVYGRDK